MSMVLKLISYVTAAERQIDEQIFRLNSYVIEIDDVTKRVEDDLSGSNLDYGDKMIQQLSMTKKQVKETIEKLEMAKEKLIKVRMV